MSLCERVLPSNIEEKKGKGGSLSGCRWAAMTFKFTCCQPTACCYIECVPSEQRPSKAQMLLRFHYGHHGYFVILSNADTAKVVMLGRTVLIVYYPIKKMASMLCCKMIERQRYPTPRALSGRLLLRVHSPLLSLIPISCCGFPIVSG